MSARARMRAQATPSSKTGGVAAVYAELARSGFRMTTQRRLIVAEFGRLRRYVTPQELHHMLGRRRPRIARATVYRTLEVLARIGAAAREPGEHGEASYLFCAPAHHHHAVCVQCGNVDDVPCGPVERFARSLTERLRFKLRRHRLEFYGVCRDCAHA